jgi:hypothetical protein
MSMSAAKELVREAVAISAQLPSPEKLQLDAIIVIRSVRNLPDADLARATHDFGSHFSAHQLDLLYRDLYHCYRSFTAMGVWTYDEIPAPYDTNREEAHAITLRYLRITRLEHAFAQAEAGGRYGVH